MNSTLCEQICNNTVGGYECKCEDGYQIVAGTNHCTGIVELHTIIICIHTIQVLHACEHQTHVSQQTLMNVSSRKSMNASRIAQILWALLPVAVRRDSH